MTQPHPPFLLLLLLVVLASVVESHYEFIKLPSDGAGRRTGEANEDTGKNWAILVAGSTGYYNYRHQADICHAYQIMKKGGLKDENIVVFMYDDIAYNGLNPRQGVIVNRPNGENVYAGVPKDYNGENANVDNFLAVLQGNKSALTGGSGKIVNSGPNDHIFIFYSGHGGPGVLGMPSGRHLYADDLIAALKKKHASTSYKSMVFYLESCESGSIFEGLLPEGINIYAATASKANEDSYATYYWYYGTALGDLFSVSWMEDSERSNARMETLKEQYQLVKERTSVNGTYKYGSHVMQYGNLELGDDKLGTYFGFIPGNTNAGSTDNNVLPPISESVNQRDADLFYFWHKFQRAREGSSEKLNAQKQLLDALAHRSHVDNSVQLIGKLLFGTEKGSEILKTLRPAGQPLVDDWSCLKSLVRTFETYCGSLSQYGMKHMRSLANFCNAGVGMEKMAVVASQACPTIPSNPWSSLHMGLSA